MGSDLNRLFADAFQHLGGQRPVPAIEVRFYPYAGLHHTIRLRSSRLYVRLSDICKESSVNVHRALAFILVAKLLSKRVPVAHERTYREFTARPEVQRASDIARRGRGRKMVSSPQGRVYNLDRMFSRLNRRFFDSRLEKPTITWSQRRTRRILGHTIESTRPLRSANHWTRLKSRWLSSTSSIMKCCTSNIRRGERPAVLPPALFRADERRFPTTTTRSAGSESIAPAKNARAEPLDPQILAAAAHSTFFDYRTSLGTLLPLTLIEPR